MSCPCGKGESLGQCCGPLIEGSPAATPEALMRSRYVAYSLKNVDYVLATTDPQHRPLVPMPEVRAWMEECTFTALEVLSAGEDGPRGRVEFRAHYLDRDGVRHVHHERSRFRKLGGRWFFREGKVISS